MEKNQATFGKVKYGLHGQPLPNFFYRQGPDAPLKSTPTRLNDEGSVEAERPQTTIEWWKHSGRYKDKPKYISSRELNWKKKYWAKPDEHFLTELKAVDAPEDDFKKDRKLKLVKNQDVEGYWEKPTSKVINDRSNSQQKSSSVSKYQHSQKKNKERYSDLYSKKSAKAERNNANQTLSHEAYFCNLPMYSSFTKDKIFPP